MEAQYSAILVACCTIGNNGSGKDQLGEILANYKDGKPLVDEKTAGFWSIFPGKIER